jgi:hypothetical protein
MRDKTRSVKTKRAKELADEGQHIGQDANMDKVEAR